jgi:hypothetical protein
MAYPLNCKEHIPSLASEKSEDSSKRLASVPEALATERGTMKLKPSEDLMRTKSDVGWDAKKRRWIG